MDERTHQHPIRMSALQKCAFCNRTENDKADSAQNASDIGMVPCLDCFGSTLYCSIECRVNDIVNHSMNCRKTRLIISKPKNERIGVLRIKQLNLGREKGLPKLLSNMLDQLTAEEKRNNVYFLCMPFDTSQVVNASSPIKECPRAKLVTRMVAPAMRQAYEWYIRHVDDRRGHDFIYMFVYPPDISFVEIVALPCDSKDESSGMLEHTLQACACSLHAGTPT